MLWLTPLIRLEQRISSAMKLLCRNYGVRFTASALILTRSVVMALAHRVHIWLTLRKTNDWLPTLPYTSRLYHSVLKNSSDTIFSLPQVLATFRRNRVVHAVPTGVSTTYTITIPNDTIQPSVSRHLVYIHVPTHCLSASILQDTTKYPWCPSPNKRSMRTMVLLCRYTSGTAESPWLSRGIARWPPGYPYTLFSGSWAFELGASSCTLSALLSPWLPTNWSALSLHQFDFKQVPRFSGRKKPECVQGRHTNYQRWGTTAEQIWSW